jgi:hypothetical protein
MPRITRKATECRLRQAAANLHDMERGTFDYGPGKAPILRSGRPKVVKTIAFTTPGDISDKMYTREYARQNLKTLMDVDYFKQHYALLQQQHDGTMTQMLERLQGSTKEVTEISAGLVRLLRCRLEDPEEAAKVRTVDLLKYGPAWYKMGMELEGKVGGEHTNQLAVVLMDMNERIQDPEERDRIRQGLEDYRAQRAEQVRSYQMAGEAIDHGDIIDSEEWAEEAAE